MIEPKVKAATGGATVAGAVVWALSQYVFHGVLPVPVEALVNVAVPGAVAFVGGYFARHVDRPKTLTNQDIAAIAYHATTGAQRLRGTYRPSDAVQRGVTLADHPIHTVNTAPTSVATSPARPPEAAQPPAQPETPNPEENPMSILDPFKALVEQLRGEVINKVAPEVADDIHAAFDLFKGQSAQLLIEAGHDAQTDAATIAADATKVAADTAAAVTPLAAAPAETIPAPASSPETPGTPSA